MKTNSCTFVGRLTKDPVIYVSETNPEAVRVNFNLAVETMLQKLDGTPYKKASFPRFQAWGEQALELHKRLSKGSLVRIEGRFTTRSFSDKSSDKKDAMVWTSYFEVEAWEDLQSQPTVDHQEVRMA